MRRLCLVPCVLALLLHGGPARAESFSLEEPASDTRVFQVSAKMTVTGNLEASVGGGKSQTLRLSVDAVEKYLERRLSGAGRDAEALRSLRGYQQAEASIDVDKTHSSSRLSESRRLVVAQGRRDGISRFSPEGSMTRAEVDLLTMPGDSLAALALLPRSAVEVGEKWTCESWVIQTLAGVDAVLKSDLSCEVESKANDIVTVKFAGSIEGATAGASSNITLKGKYRYQQKGKYISSLELEQKEKRSVGAISPGMDIVAKVTMERAPADSQGPLTDAVAEKIPLEAAPTSLLLHFETPWNLRMVHDRDWHVFQQTSDLAVLRLLDKGSLIAQCNIRHIPPAAAGKHTPEEMFQADIQKVLGEQFKSFTNAEEIKTDDGRYLYRVTAVGEAKSAAAGETAKATPMHWIYYLCAAPSGEQCSMVFIVQADLVEKLANRDLAMVKSVQFLTRTPTKAK